MKKLVAVLAILAVAVPAMAGTTVTAVVSGTPTNTGATFTVNYAYDGTGSFPRAFALDITTNLGTITSVTAAKTGESTSSSKGFGIFPGTIAIDSTGAVTSVGTPVAPQSDLPSGTLAGLTTSGVTVELGSLYATSDAKPTNSGTILTIGITCASSTAARTATITIAPNVARGGLVLEDATTAAVAGTLNIAIPALATDCFASGLSTYARWVSSGKPACWCPPASVTGLPTGGTGYQCLGDAAQDKYGTLRIYTNDLNLVTTNWKRTLTTAGYNACADIDHAAYGTLAVYTADLNRVTAMWKKTDTQLNAILGTRTGGTQIYCGQADVPTSYK